VSNCAAPGCKSASVEDRERMGQWMRSGRDSLATKNRADAQAFLAANAKIDGVVTTASGLQYTVVIAGDDKGQRPGPTDRVTVQYRGHLLDGTMFDSTDAHGGPASFSLNGGVIAGWKEALLLMKPGAQWRVFLPPDLGYGNAGRPNIPPGSALVYDIQLMKIEPPLPLPADQSGSVRKRVGASNAGAAPKDASQGHGVPVPAR
jgi:FKBP-type peptidyl-prolyl cis-trans isomerase